MELKNYEIKESLIDMDARTFEGYASTWDVDQTGDIIHSGAFAKSIQEGFPAKRIKILWQHNQPLGMPLEMREDSNGLYVKGKVSKTALGDEALELMRDGVVDRMSIGFMIPKGKADYDENGTRHIREVKLLEFSPVTFPANEAAVITGVKMINDALHNGAHIEDISSLVKAIDDLKTLIAKGEPQYSTPEQLEPSSEDIEALIASIKHLAAIGR
jgi:uncharacterized protein